MAGASSDRNLLFGILAVHLNFIDRDALVLAMNAWLVDKSTPLDEIMLRQGVLRPDLRELLATLVNKHLELHDGDPQRSLQALGKIDSVHDSLRSLGDAEVEASLQHVALARDPMATTPLLVTASKVDQRFRIVRFHAEGALGKVSLAFDNELNREVALKEIKERHADHPESRARFTTEARITGRLEHPGVVPVYGMGAYADGRPYYAMRFIKGESLQEAIRAFHEMGHWDAIPSERILELRRLLRHFVDACYAIHFAHSRGVLHRDIKPANIMLGKYGETLVVDWGLAKAMNKSTPGEAQDARYNGSKGESPELTMLGSVVGTPAFMSPEQAAGRIHELSPASDVFSLGATLYQLLTGTPPYVGKDSEAVLEAAKRGDIVAPRQRIRSISRALDAICQKAMAKSPDDRYATPRELADDITRWTADEVVSAYPEPLGVRTARWARRNRGWVRSAAAALILVTLVSVGAAFQVSRARRREMVALQTQQAVSGFLKGLFADTDPLGWDPDTDHFAQKSVDPQMTARELLEAGYKRLQDYELHDHPVARAEFLETIGIVYRNLGLYEQSNETLQKSLELRQLHDPQNRAAIGVNLSNLAWSLHYSGDYPAATSRYEDAVAMLEEVHGPNNAQVASTKMQLALLLSDTQVGEFERALDLMREVIRARERLFGPESEAVAIAYTAQALAQFAMGDIDAAQISADKAWSIFSERPGSSHFGIALDEHLRGLKELEEGNNPDALKYLEGSLKRFRDTLSPDHPFVALALVQHAGALLSHKDYMAAERQLNEVLRIIDHLRDEHPKRTDIRWHFARLYLETGRGDQAREMLETNKTHVETTYGEESWQYAKACEELGSLLYELNQHREALSQLHEAVAVANRVESKRPERIAYFAQSLGGMLAESGDFEGAIKHLEQAVACRRRSQIDRKLLGDALLLLGQAQLEAEKVQEAQHTLKDANKAFLGFNRNDWAARCQALLGEALLRGGLIAQAERELVRAVGIISQERPTSHDWNRHARSTLAKLYLQSGKQAQAASLGFQSLDELDIPRLKYRVRMRRFPYTMNLERLES